ncbi:hypothetical protein NEHOM01_0844 [Nematocida homosporus]|uniref:uncharacterized protein n=1 Tax=Nematocida homosporus TaxID=1912981 RepID=UPI00221EFDC7|nr:uncharacterized protein NEHOM01_0844 [Nematocida homosporus]KAI5185485.1 hypothetical protein NEHOM01_0844 [Nematocida homosporus]
MTRAKHVVAMNSKYMWMWLYYWVGVGLVLGLTHTNPKYGFETEELSENNPIERYIRPEEIIVISYLERVGVITSKTYYEVGSDGNLDRTTSWRITVSEGPNIDSEPTRPNNNEAPEDDIALPPINYGDCLTELKQVQTIKSDGKVELWLAMEDKDLFHQMETLFFLLHILDAPRVVVNLVEIKDSALNPIHSSQLKRFECLPESIPAYIKARGLSFKIHNRLHQDFWISIINLIDKHYIIDKERCKALSTTGPIVLEISDVVLAEKKDSS